MKYDDICKCAYNYYLKYMGIKGLCAAIDINDYIVFSGGDPSIANYGGCMICVDKDNLTIEHYEETFENIKILMTAKNIKIPEEYKYKAS